MGIGFQHILPTILNGTVFSVPTRNVDGVVFTLGKRPMTKTERRAQSKGHCGGSIMRWSNRMKLLAIMYWAAAAFLLWTLSVPAPEGWDLDWLIWLAVGTNIIAGIMIWRIDVRLH